MQLLILCRKQTMAAIRYLACATFPGRHSAKTYDPMRGLAAGTIFPELDKPFTGKCNMNMMQGGRRR